VILHALELTGLGLAAALVPSLGLAATVYVIGKLEARAERRYLAAIERNREAARAQLRMHERHRSEMRCLGGCDAPTAGERWGMVR
jgi:hypothetical protein